MRINTKCSNYASETCPCVLAESGHCIVCSMCRGESFCDCSDTVSFCVLQELRNNGGKAKEQHRTLECEVVHEKIYDDAVKLLRVKIPSEKIYDFIALGAFVFIRTRENVFYDVPISVMFEDTGNEETIGLLIQLQGIKTECFRSIKQGDHVYIRGPYFNGVQGRKAISSLQDEKAVVVCRGIGFFPSLHVIAELRKNRNSIEVFLDSASFDQTLLRIAKDLYEVEVKEIRVCDEEGRLTPAICRVVDESVKSGAGLIHFGMSDYLIKQMISYVETTWNKKVPLSCSNNSHMCCGEGICGACTVNQGPRKIVHLCKEQVDIYEYKKLLM